MAKINEVLESTKLFQIAEDARNLLSKMQDSEDWTDTYDNGLKAYSISHSKVEMIAFKVAISFHTLWVMGKIACRIFLIPTNILAEKIGECDLSQEEYLPRLASIF